MKKATSTQPPKKKKAPQTTAATEEKEITSGLEAAAEAQEQETPDTDTVLRIDSINKILDKKRVLFDVSIEIKQGEVF